MSNGQSENGVRSRFIEDEMRESYMDYAMSVIVGRALPDARDGLKPVHRRILYAMKEMGCTNDKPYKKSARIVGEVLGKYHPHGDSAVYDALVRMVQGFSLRYPMIDGQGNFGSIDGDNAAAMRYTEVRMDKIAESMLADIDKETVEFVPNFDGSLEEPSVLPAAIPNLLVNGSSGIAVGMATNIPPHNLGEVVDGLVALIDKPEIEIEELMQYVKGPDFPTGAIIRGRNGIKAAYVLGKGSIKVRARVEFEKKKENRERIIVKELPYAVNKADLIATIAELVKSKRIEGISDLRDESDREGMRIVIDLKKDANRDVVLNQLYARTYMESTFGVNSVAIVDGKPRVLTLKLALQEYLKFRQQVVRKRSEFELSKASERAHILEGLKVALSNIDPVVKSIKAASNPQEAKEVLVENFSLSEKQAQAILEMRLQRLTSLEREKINGELEELVKRIAWLKEVLADEAKILKLIRDELLDVKSRYADERRTEIMEAAEDIEIEDLIKRERVVVVLTKNGYAKRVPLKEYRVQSRGGKGIVGVETKEEDYAEEVVICSTHDYLMFFTDKGTVHWLKAYQLPKTSRYGLGKAIVNLLNLHHGSITAMIPVSEFGADEFLVMATEKGLIKRTDLKAYSRPRKGGIIAITLREGDSLIEVKRMRAGQEILLATEKGMAIRFEEKEVREIGRTGQGVRGIKLRKGDK
ncbi:DNA gyrase subunit A, partial [Candidatus Micrarchaeota archaeon]